MAFERIKTLADRHGYDLSEYSKSLLTVLDREVASSSVREILHDALSRADKKSLFELAFVDVVDELSYPLEEYDVRNRAFPVFSVAMADAIRDAIETASEAMDPFSAESEITYMIAALPDATPEDVVNHVMEVVREEFSHEDEIEVTPGEPTTSGMDGLGFIKGVGKFFGQIGRGAAKALPVVAFGPLALISPEIIKNTVKKFATGVATQMSPEINTMVEQSSRNIAASYPVISKKISEEAVKSMKEMFIPAPLDPILRKREQVFPIGPIVAISGGVILLLALLKK